MNEDILLVRIIHYESIVFQFIKKFQLASVSQLALINDNGFFGFIFKLFFSFHCIHPVVLVFIYLTVHLLLLRLIVLWFIKLEYMSLIRCDSRWSLPHESNRSHFSILILIVHKTTLLLLHHIAWIRSEILLLIRSSILLILILTLQLRRHSRGHFTLNCLILLLHHFLMQNRLLLL